jgi:hypothetical protein
MLRRGLRPTWISILVGTALAVLSSQAASAQVPVILGTNFDSEWLRREGELRIQLDRMPDPGTGRLAVFVGHTDVTGLVDIDGNELRYDASMVPLRSGEDQVVVYLVGTDGSWTELGRRSVRVLTRAGFEVAQFDPRLDVTVESRVAEDHNDDFSDPDRDTYVKVTGNGGFTSAHKWQEVEANARMSVVGSSFQDEALRFFQDGSSAPKVDVSDYLFEVRRGRFGAAMGQFNYGGHRHLIYNIQNRGFRMDAQLHDRVDVSSVTVSGNRLVGWDHFSGVDDSDSRITAATLGLGLWQSETASARFEGTYMTGETTPDANFNFGEVLDTESSRGYGLRLLGQALSGRVRADGSYARTSFDNPKDQRLFVGGQEPASVDTVTKNAWWGELAVDALVNQPVWRDRTASLTFFGNFERVDPQYKSLGAFTNSDHQTPEVGFRSDLSGASLEFRYRRDRDNLDDIDDILETKTREYHFLSYWPLPYMVGGYQRPLRWLPSLNYSYDRVRQFGANDPDPFTSGFAPSSIPDQRSTLHQVMATWQFDYWSFSYRYFNSDQDNRQEGRENADFKENSHDVTASVQPHETLFVNASGRYSDQRAQDINLTRRLLSGAFGLDWRFLPDWSFTTNLSRTHQEDSQDLGEQNSSTIDAQLAYQFEIPVPGMRPRSGRAYLRFFRTSNRFEDNSFGFNTRARQWGLLMGVSASVF